jgi:hypothetical protein
MPKQSTIFKGKGTAKGAKTKLAVTEADDDFDDMLTELRATYVTAEAANSSSTSSSNSADTSLSSTTNPAWTAIPEEALMRACDRGDVSQLRRWARWGFRVTRKKSLYNAVLESEYEMALCLVRELGADVNQVGHRGMSALGFAAHRGNVGMVKYLANELEADVNHADAEGRTPLFFATLKVHLAVVRCLVKELRASVERGKLSARLASLHLAAQQARLKIVQCLVEELHADVNLASQGGSTPLMIAAANMNHKIVRYLLKHGAHPQATHGGVATAAELSKSKTAPAEETAYLKARTHCANPSCTNSGLKKCERCLQAYFCGSACIRAHWPAHMAECTAAAAKLKAAGGKPSSSSSSSSSHLSSS